MSEYIPIDEARNLPIQARRDELDLLEAYVDENYIEIDAEAIDRHIIARRMAIAAIGTRQPDSEVKPTRPPQLEMPLSLYGRTLDQWHTFLTGSNLDVPVSRYGRNASEVAWWAVAALIVYDSYMGEPDEIDEFADHAMSMVVNDDNQIGHFIKANLHLLPSEVLENLDWSAVEEGKPEAEIESETLTLEVTAEAVKVEPSAELAAEAVMHARIDEVRHLKEVIQMNSVKDPPWWVRSVVDARTIHFKLDEWKEMIEDPDQRIGRPRQLYRGDVERPYKELGKR